MLERPLEPAVDYGWLAQTCRLFAKRASDRYSQRRWIELAEHCELLSSDGTLPLREPAAS